MQVKLKKQKTQRTPKELEVEAAEEEEEEEGVVEEADVAVDVAVENLVETPRPRRNPVVP